MDIIAPEKTIVIHRRTRLSVERYQKNIEKALAAMRRAEQRNKDESRIDEETLQIRINK